MRRERCAPGAERSSRSLDGWRANARWVTGSWRGCPPGSGSSRQRFAPSAARRSSWLMIRGRRTSAMFRPSAALTEAARAVADQAISAAARRQLVERVLQAFTDRYVFPELAARVAIAIRERAVRGEYDSISDAQAFAERLTADLRAACQDQHVLVYFSADPRPLWLDGEPPADELERLARVGAVQNYGFRRVERLGGNVGYLEVQAFFAATDAGAAATAVGVTPDIAVPAADALPTAYRAALQHVIARATDRDVGGLAAE